MENIQKIKKLPDNYTAVTAWIISPSTKDLIEFLKSALGAEEIADSRITN